MRQKAVIRTRRTRRQFGSVTALAETDKQEFGGSWSQHTVGVRRGRLLTTLTPCRQISSLQRALSADKGGKDISSFERKARLDCSCVMLVFLLFSHPPPHSPSLPSASFLPALSFVGAVHSGSALKLKTFSVCLLLVNTRLFPSFPENGVCHAF